MTQVQSSFIDCLYHYNAGKAAAKLQLGPWKWAEGQGFKFSDLPFDLREAFCEGQQEVRQELRKVAG